MAIFKWPGWIWLAHTAENSAVVFAATLASVMTTAARHELGAIDWPHALSQAAFESLFVALVAVGSLKVGNGTASLNPNVVEIGRRK